MESVVHQAKSTGVSVLIGAAGIGAQLTDLELWLKVGIGAATLFILGVRGIIAVMDLRKRLREEKCSQSSLNQPPTA